MAELAEIKEEEVVEHFLKSLDSGKSNATAGLDVCDLQASAKILYHPLDDSQQYTRLLTLSKTNRGQISCNLDQIKLSDQHKYTALSYYWGAANDTRAMRVNDITFQVTRNLYDALDRLHGMGVSRLWVDALCINQSDNSERGHQVQLMKTIYSEAADVIVWIGKSSEDSSHAITALKRMPGAKSPGARDMIWQKLENLFTRPYWKRIWIIQEITVAKIVKIVCGRDTIMWDELERANEAYELRPIHMALDNTNYSYIKNISYFRKKFLNGTPIKLLEAMFTSQQALASVPHDKIFGLLGLCYDGSTLVPTPNYEQSIEELLQDLTRNFIHLYRSLDFVFVVKLNKTTRSTLPCWTPNWLEPWDTAATSLLDLQPQSIQSIFSADAIDEPRHLRIEGRVLARCVDTGYLAVKNHTRRCTDRETRDVLCELLFLDSFLDKKEPGYSISDTISPETWFKSARQVLQYLWTPGSSTSGQISPEAWLKSARQVLRHLRTPGNERSELREAIHVTHHKEHPICSLKRENKWRAKEEPWARHLCYHPDHPMDYELNTFNEVMTWLDEILLPKYHCIVLNPGDQSVDVEKEFWNRLLDLESPPGGVLPYTEEITSSIIQAARQRRRLFDTSTGHLVLVNSFVKKGDLIFQMQGSTGSAVLRPSKYLRISDPKMRYKIISKVHISTLDRPDFVPDPEHVDTKIRTFEIY